MKLAIAGLLLIAFCSVNASVVGRSSYVTYDCPNIVLTDPDGGVPGVVVNYSGAKRSTRSYCTIQITAPPGQTLHLDVYMENLGGSMFPNCANGGRLTVYAGADASGTPIINACDAFPLGSFDLSTSQAFVNFEKDAVGDNFIVQAIFKSKRDAELLEKLDHLGEKADKKENKHHHHHHSHH